MGREKPAGHNRHETGVYMCASTLCMPGEDTRIEKQEILLLVLLELSARLKGSRCWMDTTNRMSSGLMKDTSETRSNKP